MAERLQHEIMQLKRQAKELEGIEKRIRDYIDAFNRSLCECETEEGRDSMRKVQFFLNNVNVETKYDNTAYITALGAILANGKSGPIKELKKVNPVPFDHE